MRKKNSTQDPLIRFLYGSGVGNQLLKILISPGVSRLAGCFLDTRFSTFLIPGFIKKNGISTAECEKERFDSFNDFFTRKLVEGARKIPEKPELFISPCDSRLSVYPITGEARFCVKDTAYTLEELLRDEKLAKRYQGGYLWLYRLSVDDYHRYVYPCTAKKSSNVRIPGVFHTVNPIAGEKMPIYKENTREYCLLKTAEAGTLLMMEVGAMLVGKIVNHKKGASAVERGEEKGYFAFGGSTILVLTQAGKVKPDQRILENTELGIETRVKQGEIVGTIPDWKGRNENEME